MYSVLFEVFGIPVRSYGVMLVIGFLVGLWRAIKVAPKYNITKDNVYDLGLIVIITGIVGARLVFILINPDTESMGQFFAVWEGGLSFQGGLGLATLAGGLYVWRKGISFWQCADLMAPSIAIAYAFARIGCFLNGCCYGIPTDVPWACTFGSHGHLTPPSHPTQIYASITNFAIFFALRWLEKLDKRSGFVFMSYLCLYSIYRFLIEFLRKGATAKEMFLGITEAQVASAIVLAVSAIAIVVYFGRETTREKESSQ